MFYSKKTSKGNHLFDSLKRCVLLDLDFCYSGCTGLLIARNGRAFSQAHDNAVALVSTKDTSLELTVLKE